LDRKERAMTGGAKTTTDNKEIQRWAAARGGVPAVAAGRDHGDDGELCIVFPDVPAPSDEETERISWDEWFRTLEKDGLVFVYQEETADGSPSLFNLLLSRTRVPAA
jgi:hypothetical protein